VADEPRKAPRKRRAKSTSARKRPAGPATEYSEGYGHPGHGEDESVGGHAEFVQRHFGGGVEPTPELFDRAIEVWQRLPGAVVGSAAQARPNRPTPATGGDDEEAAS
jgi:hypothetical protein